jgi:hypothetical protein
LEEPHGGSGGNDTGNGEGGKQSTSAGASNTNGGSTAGSGSSSGGASNGGSTQNGGSSNARGGSTGSNGGSSNGNGGRSSGGNTSTGKGGNTGSGGSTTGSGGSTSATPGGIPSWTDGPGACPSGATRKEISSASQLEDATRGEGSYSSDSASTCYVIKNGTYKQDGDTLLMYVNKSGTDATHRRVFVGESRTGVIIHGRADIAVSHIQISNVTFDLSGYSQSGSFNTVSLKEGGSDIVLDHITFTGDCKTGASGGHVEITGANDVLLEASIVEKFGRCGTSDGHEDHGVYLADGKNITIRNNDIRGNASRGILLNTQGGEYGKLDQITIELNAVHDNGHADYEDGIMMNATDSGTISNVVIRRNVIFGNRYSGLRQLGDSFTNVTISQNTFFHNGAASSAAGRSEANLDDTGSGAATVYSKNILVASGKVLNNCYDSAGRGFAFKDNWVQGTLPSGTAGNCISNSTNGDPQFAAASDFHPQNDAAEGFGAFSP